MQIPTVPIITDTEMQMWREYLTFLNSLSNRPLTDRELDVISYFLTCPLTVSNPLRGQSRKDLKKLFNIREQTLAMHIGNIKEKGWLSSEGKKYLLPDILQKTRDQVKSTNDYQINVSLNISYEPRRSNKEDSKEDGYTGATRKVGYNGSVENHKKVSFRPIEQ